ARCTERAAGTYSGQFQRKVRIVNRAFRSVLRTPAVLRPDRVGVFALQVWLHKMLRWFVPFSLAGTMVFGSLAAPAAPAYGWVALAELIGILIACAGTLLWLRRVRVLQAAWYFCVVNAAAALGVIGACFGRRYLFWQSSRVDGAPL